MAYENLNTRISPELKSLLDTYVRENGTTIQAMVNEALEEYLKKKERAEMKLKSHTEQEIRAAFARGEKVFALDTGNDGEDDTLIGSQDECLADIFCYHEIDELPGHWSLIEVDWMG